MPDQDQNANPTPVNLPAIPTTADGVHIPRITLVPAGTQGTAIMPPSAASPRWWVILLVVLAGIILLAALTIGIIHLAIGAKSSQVDAVKADTAAIKADAAFTRKLAEDTLPYANGNRVHLPNLIEAQGEATRMEVRDQHKATRKAIGESEGRIKARISSEGHRTRIAIGDAAKREQRIRVIILPDGSAKAVRQ